MTDKQKKERNLKSAKKYAAKKRLESGKQPREVTETKRRDRNEYHREYYEKNTKSKRVKLTTEELHERHLQSVRKYAAKKRPATPTKEPKIKKEAAPKIEKQKHMKLTAEEKKFKLQQYRKDYYLKNKDKIDTKNKNFVQTNRDKVSEYNRKQRDKRKDWTPEQWEEHRAKAREYRKQNAEKIQAQERARGPKKRERFKEDASAVERLREKERERYQQIMNDPNRSEKLRAKWRRDGDRKKAKKIEKGVV